jgi:EmrB/QacA subfamily drug resistance transporter
MKSSHKWTVVAVVLIGPAMALMDTTIVSVILSQLQEAFRTDFQTITWVISAYFLTQAAVFPIVGYVSDRIGSKQIFLIALALFTVGSLLCALAPTKEALIAFRVLQGIGGGALVPMSYAINYRLFPPSERGKLTAASSIPLLLAPTFAPTIGGYLTSIFDWRAVFLINVPVGILALLLAFLLLPGRASNQNQQAKGAWKHFDILGLLLSMVGVTALVSSVSAASSIGWEEPSVLIPLLFGAAVLVVFTIVELRVSDPVLDLRIFKNSTFTIANVLIWFLIGVYTGGSFLLPLFLESVQRDTPLIAGEFLISAGLSVSVSTTISGLLYNRMGPRILTVFGLLLLASGTYGLTQIDVNTTGQGLQIWLILRGLGMGFIFQPLQTLALSVVSNKGMAKASSLVNVTRQLATAIAVAALTAYLTEQTVTRGVAPQATAGGIADTFWLVLILSVICIPLALLIRGDPALEAQKRTKLAVGQVQEGSHEAQTQGTEFEPRAGLAQSIGQEPALSAPTVPTKGLPNVISTLTAYGEEVMGPGCLLWRSPNDDVGDGSLLIVGSDCFCVLKLCGAIHNIYEAGQYTLHTPDDHLYCSMQLTFSGEPILGLYEAIYINRARILVKKNGVVLSREMIEVNYHVDYSIHIANRADAVKLVEHIPHRVHTLSTQDINAYAKPVIEHTLNQRVQATSLWSNRRELQMQELSQQVRQSLQESISTYGITLDEVRVLVAPRDELLKGPILQNASI